MDLASMTLNEIGVIIDESWTKPCFGAHPYIYAMCNIQKDMCGLDSWDNVVTYFLANAQTWRGDVARQVKAELKKRLKQKTP